MDSCNYPYNVKSLRNLKGENKIFSQFKESHAHNVNNFGF